MNIFRMTAFMAIVVICTLAVTAQPPSQGQRRSMTEEDVRSRIDNLAKTLEMTGDQKSKILNFELEAFAKREEELKKHQGDREAMRLYYRNYRQERDDFYQNVLSEEQMARYREMQEQRRQEMQQRRQQNR
jgi:hypothetical protein